MNWRTRRFSEGWTLPQREVPTVGPSPTGAQKDIAFGNRVLCTFMDETDTVTVGDFLSPGDMATFLDGSERSVTRIGPTWIGRGRYLPGWRWSQHVRPIHGRESTVHAGFILSGRMAVRGIDGTEVIVRSGEAFYAAPGHDAWVLGDEQCVALDFPRA